MTRSTVLHVFACKFAPSNWYKPRQEERVLSFWTFHVRCRNQRNEDCSECVSSSNTNIRWAPAFKAAMN
ncbi:hypothetical protein Y032_0021g406 [Ancylostoma ceylanicum]|nr:hypothetical protein Y032_0021g406 [Ancylostoma ceylanicum]